MFNWVCPRCGRDNSPSYTECPDCKERDLQAQAAAALQPPQPAVAPQPNQYQEPPSPQFARDWQAPVPQPQYAPQQPPQYIQQPAQPSPQQPPQQYPPQPPQYQPPQYQQGPPQTQQATQPQLPPHQYVPQQPQYAPQPPNYPPLPPNYQPPRPAGIPRRTGLSALPVWLLMILFAFAFLGVGAAIFYGYQRYSRTGPAGFTGGEQAAAVAPKSKATNPMQKYIEVVGIRLTTDAKKKPLAKFLVVNHASNELNELAANVTLWASTSRSEEDAVGSFSFKVDTLRANDSKDMSALLKTKLKMYELPDWQNLTAEVQVTSAQ